MKLLGHIKNSCPARTYVGYHAGKGGVTMPGKGKIILRPYSPEERAAIEQGTEALGLSAEEALAQLGDQSVEFCLNAVAYWTRECAADQPSGVR